MKIKLSICIPTKNRYSTLKKVINSILLNVKDQNIEIIVQDNSNDNSLFLEYIANTNDHRLIYRYSSGDLTMAENVELSTINVRGEFLVVIGDDDFIHPKIINILNQLDTQNKDCFIYDRGVYYWPDMVFTNYSKYFKPSSLQTLKSPSFKLSKLDSVSALCRLGEEGGFYLNELPGAYHAIVRVTIVDSIRQKFGKFVLGPSPDMAMAVAIACTIKNYYRVNFPLTIPGASFTSAAGMGRRGEHSASLDNVPLSMPQNLKYDWTNGVPEIWNGFTLYVHTAILVAKLFNHKLLINKSKFCKKLISDNIKDKEIVQKSEYFKSLHSWQKFSSVVLAVIVFHLKFNFWHLPNIITNYIMGKKKAWRKMDVIDNISTPSEAMKLLSLRYDNILKDVERD
jgi:glycosyltransferase involved in cell wall biosynthesis